MPAIVLSYRNNSTKSPATGERDIPLGGLSHSPVQQGKSSEPTRASRATGATCDLRPAQKGARPIGLPSQECELINAETCRLSAVGRRPQECIERLSTGESKLQVRKRDSEEAKNWSEEGVQREVSLEVTDKGSDRGGNPVVHDTHRSTQGSFSPCSSPFTSLPFSAGDEKSSASQNQKTR